jgi:hypothetical protein
MLIGTPAILRNVKTVRKRSSVTSHPCGSFVFITLFLSYNHKYVRMSDEIDLLYKSKRQCAHGFVSTSSYGAQLTSGETSSLFLYKSTWAKPTVGHAVFMRHEVDWRLLVPSAFAWVKRAVILLRKALRVTWKVLCSMLEELFNDRHEEVMSWIHKITRVTYPILEELCIFTEYVLLV